MGCSPDTLAPTDIPIKDAKDGDAGTDADKDAKDGGGAGTVGTEEDDDYDPNGSDGDNVGNPP